MSASDTLTGGITFKVGTTGAWQTVNVGDGSTATTLSGLSAAINNAEPGRNGQCVNQCGRHAKAFAGEPDQWLRRPDHDCAMRQQLDSTARSTLTDSTTTDTNPGLGLATIQNGRDATITVDGVTGITSASNTVTNAIPGVTFQLLSTGTASSDGTPETVQVVIANDTSSIETAINTFVTDYNTTMKAINAQEGKDSSGNPEPLYGTSVLAQLQEGLLSAVSSIFRLQHDQFADLSRHHRKCERRRHDQPRRRYA